MVNDPSPGQIREYCCSVKYKHVGVNSVNTNVISGIEGMKDNKSVNMLVNVCICI